MNCKRINNAQNFLTHLFPPSNQEIYTSLSLVKDILNKLPEEVWSDPTLRWLNPACKNGIWLSEIFLRLMKGLKKWEPDHQKRNDHIFNYMLYGFAYTQIGLYLTKKTLYGNKNAVGNVKLIEFLKRDIKNMKFDIIVGNPPYQTPNKKRGVSSILWDRFVKKSLLFLEENGYLCFIHPRKWRKPDDKLWQLMTSKQIHYLEIHNLKDGQKMFNVDTRYDWYILQNKSYETKTEVIDETGKQNFIDLREWNFLPNHSFNFIKKFLNNSNENKIICNGYYQTVKKWVSETKSEEFKYPLIYAINQNKIRYYYSSRNNLGHFGIAKVIFCENPNMNDVIIDMEGKFGMTQCGIAIPVKNLKEAQDIKKALLSQKFKRILQATRWGNFRLEWKLFTYFKKNWWEEFKND